ncbi:MAG: YihY/virulence factor BrkB family protein [Lachnospira sp.]|nr:YihY/virulence factor BrkB family protein [Lachnospira sp.]
MNISEFIKISKEVILKLKKDYVSAFAAQVAFYVILCFFPFLLLLLTLIQFTPLTEATLMSFVNDFAPSLFRSIIISAIAELYQSVSPTLISITAVLAIWSSSKVFVSLIRGFNKIYEIDESRNYFILRFVGMLYTMVFIITIIASLSILVFGQKIINLLKTPAPLIANLIELIFSQRILVAFLVLTLLFMFAFKYIPNRKSSLTMEFPGAATASAGLIIFSTIYSIYVNNNIASTMYGSLGTLVFTMFWIYFCVYMLFIGAEVNAYFHKYIYKNSNTHIQS